MSSPTSVLYSVPLCRGAGAVWRAGAADAPTRLGSPQNPSSIAASARRTLHHGTYAVHSRTPALGGRRPGGVPLPANAGPPAVPSRPTAWPPAHASGLARWRRAAVSAKPLPTLLRGPLLYPHFNTHARIHGPASPRPRLPRPICAARAPATTTELDLQLRAGAPPWRPAQGGLAVRGGMSHLIFCHYRFRVYSPGKDSVPHFLGWEGLKPRQCGETCGHLHT